MIPCDVVLLVPYRAFLDLFDSLQGCVVYQAFRVSHLIIIPMAFLPLIR
jgi:hypothetical protein